MHFSSSAIGIATAVALVSTNVVEGCPFASSGSQYVPKNHPIVPKFHRRVQAEDNDVDFGSMFGPDGRLVGSPSLDNGAFDAPGLLTPMREDGSTIADIVAGLSAAGGNGDMCLIRFQQLPPPAAGNFSFDQNAADLLAFKVYGDMMVDRFYQLSGPDVNEGGIIFSFCTSGSGGVESLCNAGIEPERLCDERLMKNSVRWPQAITGFKLTNMTLEAVKAAIATWRTTDGGHLPSIVWSFNGGSPDLGGSQIGIWGNIGAIECKGCFDECTAPATPTPTMAPVAPTVAPVTATTSPPADSGVGTSALTVTAISVVMMVAAFAF
ncbi:unnamed protein product [Cylindrotheca closterium]|uniref:Uncharacterized protein n=1 Tax=Cylindrotheca closterium TaxID=2856 RepID=A0AAD2CQH8_9STRA|nr:unnamed protein product [Cylindrotheca closterium]